MPLVPSCVTMCHSEPVGAHNSVVGADQGFRAPFGDQESVRDSVHEDSASARIAAGQRPRPSFRHPQSKKTVESSMARQGLQGRARRRRRGLTRPDKRAEPVMAAAVRGGAVAGVIFHTDKGSQGGFNRSSQHCLVGRSVDARRGLRLGSSSRGSLGAGCAAATASRSLRECRERSVPLGKYWRSRPLVFSLVPRCQGLCGSQNGARNPWSAPTTELWAPTACHESVDGSRGCPPHHHDTKPASSPEL